MYVIPSLDASTGGPARSVSHALKYISRNKKIKLTLATRYSDNPIISEINGVDIVFVELLNIISFYRQNTFDLVHIHGVWGAYQNFFALVAKFRNIPFIISPRGMLEPWPLSKKRVKKKLAFNLYQKRILKRANFIHATSLQEKQNLSRLDITTPIRVIPNGLDMEFWDQCKNSSKSDIRTVLFLSRIDEKKGINILLESWRSLPKSVLKNSRLIICGDGDRKTVKALKDFVSYNPSLNIIYEGPVYGSDKKRTFEKSDIFILPSFSENFGIVVAEALVNGIPVITTIHTPWRELSDRKLGWYVDSTVSAIQNALLEALMLPHKQLQIMGGRGRELIVQNYNYEILAKEFIDVYLELRKDED